MYRSDFYLSDTKQIIWIRFIADFCSAVEYFRLFGVFFGKNEQKSYLLARATILRPVLCGSTNDSELVNKNLFWDCVG